MINDTPRRAAGEKPCFRGQDAVNVLTPFVSDPHNRAQAERIQKAIDAIKAGKTVSEIMNVLNGATQ